MNRGSRRSARKGRRPVGPLRARLLGCATTVSRFSPRPSTSTGWRPRPTTARRLGERLRAKRPAGRPRECGPRRTARRTGVRARPSRRRARAHAPTEVFVQLRPSGSEGTRGGDGLRSRLASRRCTSRLGDRRGMQVEHASLGPPSHAPRRLGTRLRRDSPPEAGLHVLEHVDGEGDGSRSSTAIRCRVAVVARAPGEAPSGLRTRRRLARADRGSDAPRPRRPPLPARQGAARPRRRAWLPHGSSRPCPRRRLRPLLAERRPTRRRRRCPFDPCRATCRASRRPRRPSRPTHSDPPTSRRSSSISRRSPWIAWDRSRRP